MTIRFLPTPPSGFTLRLFPSHFASTNGMQISHEAAHGATGCAGVCWRAAMLCCVSFTARLLDVLDAAVYFV